MRRRALKGYFKTLAIEDNMENSKLLEELVKARDLRAAELVNADPQWSRLQGAIDYAEGRWQIKEEEAQEDGLDNEEG